MGEINIPRVEKEALRAVDIEALRKLIEQCLREERPYALRGLRLENCGLHVVTRLRQYETALAEHGKAKAEKKACGDGISRSSRWQ